MTKKGREKLLGMKKWILKVFEKCFNSLENVLKKVVRNQFKI